MKSRRLGILYIHGFRSSPASSKSKIIQAATLNASSPLYGCAFTSPQLPSSPVESLQLLEKSIESLSDAQEVALIGSSLGGFYATILTERHHRRRGVRDGTRSGLISKTIILNPGVFPARDLAKYVGKQQFWHFPDKEYEFTAADLGELVELEKEMAEYEGSLSGKYALLACKGDETLDWREMVIRYKGHQLKLVEGSDHGISDFQGHFNFIEDFLISS